MDCHSYYSSFVFLHTALVKMITYLNYNETVPWRPNYFAGTLMCKEVLGDLHEAKQVINIAWCT